MLLAYIDEIGQPGAYVSHEHPRFNGSPAFGYAGFIIPEHSARKFGAYFTRQKRTLFKTLMERAAHPGRVEIKGASVLYARVIEERPENVRVLGALIAALRNMGGHLFYYADEKPVGTPKQTNTGPEEIVQREAAAMRETLNRLARHAKNNDESILVMMDQINEASRRQRLPLMYEHILGRATEYDEMRSIVEPPMHIDSQLSSNIQFADWVAALVGRAIDCQLVQNSRYQWICETKKIGSAYGAFTYESKLRLWSRSVSDINHSGILARERVLYPSAQGHLIGERNAEKLQQMKLAAERARQSK